MDLGRLLRSLALLIIVLATYFSTVLARHHKIRHHHRRHKRQHEHNGTHYGGGRPSYLPGSFVVEGGGDGDTGNWGPWSEPSDCSRSCGGGVAFQTRQCSDVSVDGDEVCKGGFKRYFSCNIQDCPEDRDFRSDQCAEFNDEPFEGRHYEWVPYTKAPNVCELNCMPRGERFYYRHKRKVVDGTRCDDEKLDICVDGQCLPVGCDNMLGSNAREDECRECGGDGSSCNTVRGLVEIDYLQAGYNDILLIPAGATNIEIREVRASNNYLAIRNESGHYYLNGNWKIDYPRSLRFAGSIFHYERKPHSFYAPETITCLGPTSEPIYVVMLYQETNPGVEYQYSIPKGIAQQTDPDSYSWIYDDFSTCSATCGGGYQLRNVTCARRRDLEIVPDYLCDPVLEPKRNQSCSTDPCPPDWSLGGWGPCSETCGEGGVQIRQVYCERIVSNGLPSVVEDEQCSDVLGPKPPMTQECNQDVACPTWHVGPWKPCNRLCGDGVQKRRIRCYIRVEGKIQVLEDSACSEEKPQFEKPCLLRPCEGVDWVLSDWSGCEDKCGLTYETRKAHCSNQMGKVYPDNRCHRYRLPNLIRECENQVSCEYEWFASQWSECSARCGNGIQTRKVFCGTFDGETVKKVNDGKCKEENKYEGLNNCTGKEECSGQWYSAPWSSCSKTCGGGLMTRKVLCFIENKTVDVRNCDPSLTPFSTESCNNQQCSRDQILPLEPATVVSEEEECIEEYDTSFIVMDTTLGLGEMGATPLSSLGGTDLSSDTSEISGMASELSSLSTQGSVSSSGLTSSASTDSSSLLTDFITPSSLDTATISQDVMLSDSTDVSSDSPLSSLSSDGIKLTELSSTSLSEEISSSLSSDLSATPGTTTSDYVNYVFTESSLSSLSDITSSSDIDSTFLSSDTSPASSGSLSTDSSSNGETLSTSSTDSLSSSSESGSPKTDTTLSGGSSVSLNYYYSDLSSSSDDVSPQTDTTSSDSSSTSVDTSPPTIDTTSRSDSSSVSETIEGSGMTTGSLDVDELLTTLITGSGMSSLETKPSPDTDFVVEADFDESEGSGDLEAVSTPTAMSPSEMSEGSTLFSQDTSTDSATESSNIFSTDIYSTLFTTLSSVFTTSSSEESTLYSTTESSPTEMFTESSYSESSSSEISSTEASSEISTVITTESIELTSTESSSEISTSTDTTEYSTVGSTDVTSTEVSGSSAGGDGSTVSGDDKEEVTTPSPAQVAVTNEQKERKCRRRKKPVQEPEVVKCEDSKFGCCSDGITEAQGPFNKGCPQPTTCSETEFKCCSDGVSPAEGPNEEGCPPSLCKETLFGCCPDGVNIAEGNDFEGCEGDMVPFLCNKTEFGCCPDGLVAATGPDNEGCFTCEGSGECESCNETKFGCCPDGLRAASGDNFTGCEQPEEGSGDGFLPVTKEPEPEVDCAESEHGCCPDGLTVATGPNFDGCGVIDTDNCTMSYFRCCPDGSTPALGPQYEGCRMPCEDEVYGCCADRVTPAHGPSQEGCCLNTPYGCCPDNILPAQGANLEGCGCQYSTYRCCPDNVTAARGANNEGCGCQYTPHGCCPNGYTPAAGPSFQGCPCYTFQFGCCPDGITIARGPQNQGCGCENTQFGCCSDDRTPASGPELEGCGCEASKFGCCPDGVVEAQGDKFEGCDDVPLIAADACTQEKDRGSCRDFTVKWFFDTEYGGCSRFWYGGCDGNNNRFKSQDECKAVCIEPPGREACFLPKIEGPCEGYYPTWHYDAERKQCRQFIYGGCLGNNNKFQTREECDELCVTPDTIDACDQPKFEGPCRGNFSRWYFDKESGICSEFSYGGCKGNGNNFYTESACHQQCLQPGRSRVMDVCALPKDMGPCPGAILRWHYDAIQQTCKQFVYGGCQGNGNRFRTEEDCRTKCHVSATTREQDTCTLPAMVGECHNYTERWYYDSFEVRCRPFYYGGCGGNHNNFLNMQDCQQRCEAGYNTPEPPEQYKTEYCFLPDDHGPCSESVAHWFYDSRDGVCKQFLYGGCQGNQNRFASRQDCEQSCGNVQDKCILPRVVGPCSGSIQQWYYEQRSNNCEEFDYGGCQGNANRFNDRQECEESCKRGVPEITTAGPRILEPKTDNSLSVFQPVDICLTHVDPGPCRGQNSAWYFDYSSLSCQAFVYGGCGGNANRFESEEQCERQCGIFKGQDVCTIPYEIGPCRGLFRKWYFDSTSGHCQEFDYGGCSGNGNRFSSISECESICLHREELLPTGDDTSLSHQANEIDVDSPREKADGLCAEAREECNKLHCPYRVEKFVDSSDCERCRCHDPCRDQYCPEDTLCAVDLYHNDETSRTEFRAICRQVNKPGLCPRLTPITGNCIEECTTDADCVEDFKCCFNGCGSSCVHSLAPEAQILTTLPSTSQPTEAQTQTLARGEVPPSIVDTEPVLTAEEGSQATLRCIATGSPTPSISWRKDRLTITGSNGRTKILLDGSLQIIGLQRSDAGVYICFADNGVGQPSYKEITLDITVPVQANVSMSQTVFPVGSDISIPCDVDGYPIPRVTWYKDGQPLQPEDRLQISESHRLLIIRSNSNDTGEYRCEAFNQYGTSTSSTTITVEGVYIHPNCTDNPFFANCRLIVQAQYCTHRYYARFCCKSCTLAGQLPSHGAHLEKTGSTQ